MRGPSLASICSIASSTAAAASSSPRCSSICAPDQIAPIGFAMPWPAMSGADPCTGSNIEGNSRSGFRFPEGAMPIEPATAAARSLRMSPNRLEATMTSKRPGWRTTIAASASISTCSVWSCGCLEVTAAKRSSQNGIVWMIPLDFVAEQMRPDRVAASSHAYCMTRSVPRRVNTDSWTASSSSVPWCRRPPISEYSPSLFSRTITMSTSSGAMSRRGEGMPGHSRIGRRFTYCRNARRIGISRPHSEMWSGTSGRPTAPRKIASLPPSVSSASSGIMRPVST